MKKQITVNLANDGDNVPLEAGKIRIEKTATSLRLFITGKLNNSAAGRQLTDGEKQAFLAQCLLMTLKHGADQQHKPLTLADQKLLQRIQRNIGGSEIEGYSNTVDGLGQTFDNTAKTFKLRVRIAVSQFWQDFKDGTAYGPGVFGVGPTWAKLAAWEFKRGAIAGALPANFTFVGSLAVDVSTDEFDVKFPDRVANIPRYHEWKEEDRNALKIPKGWHRFLEERSTPLATTTLLGNTLKKNGKTIYENVTPAEWFSKLLDIPFYPAESDISDRTTVLDVITPGTSLKDATPGEMSFEQTNLVLSPMLLSTYYSEVLQYEQIEKDVKAYAAAKGRTVHAVSLATLYGLELPSEVVPHIGYALLTESDQEFEMFGGLRCGPGEKDQPEIHFPVGALATTALRYKQRVKASEFDLAEGEIRQLALQCPGAVTNYRGFRDGASGRVYAKAASQVKAVADKIG